MDDYNIVSLQESSNEWVARLTNLLTPCVLDGVRAMVKESIALCAESGEQEKYLMTFQNFLSRVPKWSEEIVETEVERIRTQSACEYLADLITCVHIIQLKALTCIRVGQKQKSINIDVPKLNTFIHKVYIHLARKLFSNVYLFEANIAPLQVQRNNREIELITKDCIMEAVRESIPVNSILRAYLDETEEETLEAVEEKTADVVDVVVDGPASEATAVATPGNVDVDTAEAAVISHVDLDGELGVGPAASAAVPEVAQTIKFSDIDETQSTDKVISNTVAPKDIDTLERISDANHQKRKEEELLDALDDDSGEDRIQFMEPSAGEQITLDIETL
jgi:hypothetical protein